MVVGGGGGGAGPSRPTLPLSARAPATDMFIIIQPISGLLLNYRGLLYPDFFVFSERLDTETSWGDGANCKGPMGCEVGGGGGKFKYLSRYNERNLSFEIRSFSLIIHRPPT